jgi:hypothetical protein
MASSLRQLPVNYMAHSTLDFGRKGPLRTVWNYGSFVVWLVCSALLFWIVVSLRPGARQGLSSLSWVDVVISLVVVAISLFVGIIPLLMLYEGAHRVCFWLFTGERPRLSSFEEYRNGHTYIAPPDCYLTKPLLLIVAASPLIVWPLVSAVILTLVPMPALYWIVVPLALGSALCVTNVIAIVWALQQPRGSLFNDQGTVTTAYTPLA